MQLKEEIYTNNYSRSKGYTTIRRYNNCNELRYNVYICKKDEEISNIYNSNWFQLILNVVIN